MTKSINRRTFLLGSAGTAIAAAVPTTAAAHGSLISRNHIGNVHWGLRKWTGGFNGYGMHEYTPQARYFEFRRAFYRRCNLWAQDFWNTLVTSTVPRLGLRYFVVRYTHREYGNNRDHPNAIAMDLGAIHFWNLAEGRGDFVDMNMSWRDGASLQQHRRYIAVAASLRVYFPEVLTFSHSGHVDHIHFDINHPTTSGPLDFNTTPGSSTGRDVRIIQSACNWLNGERLAVDGVFGPVTTAAYNRLCRKFQINPNRPKRDYLAAAQFLQLIARHGLRNKLAGWYTA